MARTEKVIMTNMCMVFSENRVLVQDKRDDDYSGITFPGGHVERGESFTDVVIREVWEETGLKISEPKLCGIKDWMKDEETRYIVLLYKTDKFEGIVTSSEEGNVFWLTLDEMKQRKLAYGMDKMLEVFLNSLKINIVNPPYKCYSSYITKYINPHFNLQGVCYEEIKTISDKYRKGTSGYVI